MEPGAPALATISSRVRRPRVAAAIDFRQTLQSKTERTFQIFERLVSGEVPPTHGELMRELGVQRSTLSDALGELRDLGYVTVRDRAYLPGPRLLTFVRAAAASARLGAGVRRTLERLAAQTGETAVYVMANNDRNGAEMTVIAMDRVESDKDVRYVATIGKPYPATSTAAGHVFLAFKEPKAGRRDEVKPAVDPDDDLAAELQRVRERGYATYSPEARPSTGIAAPVRAVNGDVIGVIDVVGPSARLPDAAVGWPLLREAAAELSGSDGGGKRRSSPHSSASVDGDELAGRRRRA